MILKQKGRTALIIASALGYLEVVSILIEHGANINCRDKNGNTGKLIKYFLIKFLNFLF